MEPFVLRARRSVPRLGIQVNDRIVYDPSNPALLTLCRAIPNIGATLLAWEDGAVEPVTPSPSLEELRLAVGYPSPRRTPWRLRSSRTRLVRLK